MSAEKQEPTEPSGAVLPAPSLCPACAKPLPDRAERCPNCSIALGEHHRCVHCRAVIDVDTAPGVRFVCRLCGGVRIPIDDAAIARSPVQIELLKEATIARSATTIWGIVAAVVAAFGVSSVLVLMLVVSVAGPGITATVMAGLAALVPFAFALLAFRKSRVHRAQIAKVVEAAWMAAVSDIARARGGQIDASTLAKLTRASEGASAQLLRRMSSDHLLGSSVTPDGSLKYTLLDADGAAPRALASGD